eukprot:g764.t1
MFRGRGSTAATYLPISYHKRVRRTGGGLSGGRLDPRKHSWLGSLKQVVRKFVPPQMENVSIALCFGFLSGIVFCATVFLFFFSRTDGDFRVNLPTLHPPQYRHHHTGVPLNGLVWNYSVTCLTETSEDGHDSIREAIKPRKEKLMKTFFPHRGHDSSMYTVYIITFDRDKLVKRIIEHYAKSNLVDAIVVSWNNIDRDPPAIDSFETRGKTLHFIRETTDSLNNRFRPHPDIIRTKAIFNIDDDIIVPIEQVEFAFRVWQQFPATTIGFTKFGRSHSRYPSFSDCSNQKANDGQWFYSIECTNADSGERSFYEDGPHAAYSMALDSAFFFHADYLDLYYAGSGRSHDRNAEATLPPIFTQNDKSLAIQKAGMEYVDDTRNCEDIFFSMLVAFHSGMPPVLVDSFNHVDGKSSILHIQHENKKGHHPGLSNMAGHYHSRTKCLNDLAKLFGHMPLKYSIFKVLPVIPNEIL